MRDKPKGNHYSSIFNRGKQSSMMGDAWGGVAKFTPTYDRHTAQRGNQRRRGKAIGSKVPHLPDTHEDHAEPPHHGGVVGFGASLSLTEMSVFLLKENSVREFLDTWVVF